MSSYLDPHSYIAVAFGYIGYTGHASLKGMEYVKDQYPAYLLIILALIMILIPLFVFFIFGQEKEPERKNYIVEKREKMISDASSSSSSSSKANATKKSD